MRVILSTLIYLLTLRFRERRSLELEIAALRHQLGILRRKKKRPPRITHADRFVWSWMYLAYPRVSQWMRITKPQTVKIWRDIGCHLGGSRSYGKRGPRPKVNDQLRHLMFQMYSENVGWGGGRIQGELQKLGYEITDKTVRLNLPKHRTPPTPGWRTFLHNHRDGAAAMNVVAVVAAMSFRLLHTMIIFGVDRLKISYRVPAGSAEESGFTNEGSGGLASLPWLKSPVNDRKCHRGRRQGECRHKKSDFRQRNPAHFQHQ